MLAQQPLLCKAVCGETSPVAVPDYRRCAMSRAISESARRSLAAKRVSQASVCDYLCCQGNMPHLDCIDASTGAITGTVAVGAPDPPGLRWLRPWGLPCRIPLADPHWFVRSWSL